MKKSYYKPTGNPPGRPFKDSKGRAKSVFLSDEVWSAVEKHCILTSTNRSNLTEKVYRDYFGLDEECENLL
jgi:hypothetical protein